MAKSYSEEPEDLKKMQQYFELMLANPDGLDIRNLFSGIMMSDRDREMLNRSMAIFDDMKKQFGFDFAGEWAQLNEEIGDSIFTIDDFYSALTSAVGNVTPLSVDDILSTLEDFKERPDEWTDILTEWAAAQEYSVAIRGELDTSYVDEYMEKYLAEKYGLSSSYPTPSSYVSQAPYAYGVTPPQPVEVSLYINEQFKEKVKGDASSTVALRPRDLWMNNGK